MKKYILKRVCYAILTIFLLLLITFFMMHMLPGSPFVGDKAVSEATIRALEVRYGLDKSIIEQFFIYVKNAFQGDLGTSLQNGRPVAKIIMESFHYSAELGVRSLIFAVAAGVSLGSVAAVKRGKTADTFAMTVAVIGVSVPSFIIATLLQYFLGLKLGLFAISGWKSESAKILPALALSFGSIAQISRLMRTSMLDVLGSDYIKTAKAKGLSQRLIIMRHSVRNAIMPVITVLGPIAASILTGAFVVEKVFNIPGMGKFFVTAIQSNDYPLIAGTTLFYGTFLVLATLLVDIAYGFIDPRVKISGDKE